MAPKQDLPTVHATAKALDFEAPGPFVYGTKTGARVTFPDPSALEFEEADEFLRMIINSGSARDALRRWLSEEDYTALLADGLTWGQMTRLMEIVAKHYEVLLGTPGESPGSGMR